MAVEEEEEEGACSLDSIWRAASAQHIWTVMGEERGDDEGSSHRGRDHSQLIG